MRRLTVLAFADGPGAGEVRHEIGRLPGEHPITLEDTVRAKRGQSGNPEIRRPSGRVAARVRRRG